MNKETIPLEVRWMARHELEDEVVRLRKQLHHFECMAVFVNGDKAIDSANVEVNVKRRFLDVRTVQG